MGARAKRFLGVAIMAASLLNLSACAEFASLFEQKKPKATVSKKARPVVETVSGEEYVTQLAVGRLALMQPSADTQRAESAATALRNFHTAKPAKAKEKLPNPTLRALVIIYSNKGSSKKREVIAPIAGGYNSMSQILSRLNLQDVELHDLSVKTVTVQRSPDLAPPEDAEALDGHFAMLEDRLRGSAKELPLAQEIKAQLDLLDYFKKKRYQDAAYLMLDNVKRKLAYASQNDALDIAMLNGSMARMEAIEQDLKREMPYTL